MSVRTGSTLLELLLVVAIVGILAAVMLPSTQPSVYDQLRSTAQIVATDLAYARSLAVANDSNYRIAYDLPANRYTMKHCGVNAALNRLPRTPFSSPGDPVDQHIVDLDELPHAGHTVRLAAVTVAGATTQTIDNVEFGPLGQTVRADPTTIWLTAGNGADRRYMTVAVNPVTGLTEIGGFSSVGPLTGSTQVQ
jgi:Tfp pilus assembly protein FimT